MSTAAAGSPEAPVLLATRNPGKISEFRRLLAPLGLSVVGADELASVGRPTYVDLPETGATFGANAAVKARTACAATGLVAVTDDSGLCVDALGGMPGILSARWAGTHGDDAANLALLLAQLADLPDASRGAAFWCAAAVCVPDTGTSPSPGTPAGVPAAGAASAAPGLVGPAPGVAAAVPGGRVTVVSGVMRGSLTRAPRGDGGFGYDPVFVPAGETRTTAEMAPAEKDALSHRGKAMRALTERLPELLAG